MQGEDPPQNLIPKEKTHCNTSWVGLPEFEVSIKPIVSQSLSPSPINKIMFVNKYSKILVDRCWRRPIL